MANGLTYTYGQEYSGPRSLLSIGGVYIAYSNSSSLGHNWNWEEVRTLGNLELVSHAPTSYGATFSADKYFLVNENLLSLGIQADMGANGQTHLLNLLKQGELTADFQDQVSNKLIATVTGVHLSGSQFGIQNNQLVMINASFVCRRILEFGHSTS